MEQSTTTNHQKWFDREHLLADLKGRSVSGGMNTVSAQLLSLILTIGSTAVLARLLIPADYGLVAMVTSITGFVLIFKDLGLSQAVIQKKDIDQEQVSKVFWLNVWMSLVLGLVIVGLGPLISYFYEEPALSNITYAYAIIAVLGGFSAQHTALLKRQMLFKELASITVLGTLVGVGSAILMAYFGFGYWALVALNFFNALSTMVLLWMRCDWRPHWSRVDRSIIDLVKFGMHISGFNMINYFARNLDNVLIGKFVGKGALGLYDQAYRLLLIPVHKIRDPLNAVGIPAMSSLDSLSRRFASYYRRYIFTLAFFSMPLVLMLAVLAWPVIDVVLGDKFLDAAPYFQGLAFVSFIQPVASTRGMVMISAGHSKRFFLWGVYNTIAVAIAFFIGIQWGVMGLIISYILVNYLLVFPSLVYSYKGTSIKVSDFFEEIKFPAGFSIIAALLSHFLLQLVDQWPSILQVVAVGGFYTLSYLGLWQLSPASRQGFKSVSDEMLSKLMSKLKRKKS